MQLMSARAGARPLGRALSHLSALLLLLLPIALGGTAALAGPGHQHATKVPVSGASAPSPRVTANSPDYQLVGIADGEVLVIYLDRFVDNAPVTSAKLEVTIGDVAMPAVLQKDGTYEVSSKFLTTPGEHAVVIGIMDGNASDLLVGSIAIPRTAAPQALDHSLWAHLGLSLKPMQIAGFGFGGVLLLVGLAGLVRQSGRVFAIGAAIVGAAIVAASTAFAHEGHDHGSEATAAANGNAPQRLPDGTVFLPKPTQRLLEVRTRLLKAEAAVRTVRFQGRIVANPDKSGVVQSTIQGRFSPPDGGVPPLGTRVRAGDLMGRIAPSFVSKEASDIMQALAELDQQIALMRAKLLRNEQLLRASVVSAVTVDEIRIQLDGLLKRRSDLLAARVQPEELRAPVDGVITSVRVVAGQVVAQTDQLFQIIDPSSLFVEALLFDQAQADHIGDATAVLASGRSAKLRFLGRSRSLQQQYMVLKFEIVDQSEDLNVGAPVIVFGSTDVAVTGLRVPRAAVTQAPNGQMVVFVHNDAERFEPRAIRFEPFDADSVLLLSGIAEGEKVVIKNAPLVNQVR